MKKQKNEAVNTKGKSQENKEAANGKSTPSEYIQSESNEKKELPFKKVLYGFNPDEVQSFIDELTKSHEASLKLHESKLSSMKEELAFSNRERDRYIKKCKEYQSEAGEKPTVREDKTEEYKAAVIQLKKRIMALEEENANLKNPQAVSSADSDVLYSEKISELEQKNAEIESALLSAKKENAELTKQIEKYAAVTDEVKALMQELEETKSRLSVCKNELQNKTSEAEEKSAIINTLTTEKNNTAKKVAELEVQNNILTQRNTECEEEISKLRDANKAITFESAEKISALENEHAKNRLAVQKELKLYGYYIDRAELTVAELTKQIEQIKQSVNNSEF